MREVPYRPAGSQDLLFSSLTPRAFEVHSEALMKFPFYRYMTFPVALRYTFNGLYGVISHRTHAFVINVSRSAVTYLVEALAVHSEASGSTLDEIIGFISSCPNPSSRSVALGWTRTQTGVSARNISGRKKPRASVV
jgi:hypothetical protein